MNTNIDTGISIIYHPHAKGTSMEWSVETTDYRSVSTEKWFKDFPNAYSYACDYLGAKSIALTRNAKYTDVIEYSVVKY